MSDDASNLNWLLSTIDAADWAREWTRIARERQDKDQDVIDEGWMLTWFACAIQTGWNHHPAAIAEQQAAVDRALHG